MPVTELTINRPNWLHNEGSIKSFLLRESDGKMCCLGFYSLACGLSKDEITNVKEANLKHLSDASSLPVDMVWLGDYYASSDAHDLMSTNDNSDGEYTEEQIEAGIIETFAKHGVTVTFTDEPLCQ